MVMRCRQSGGMSTTSPGLTRWGGKRPTSTRPSPSMMRYRSAVPRRRCHWVVTPGGTRARAIDTLGSSGVLELEDETPLLRLYLAPRIKLLDSLFHSSSTSGNADGTTNTALPSFHPYFRAWSMSHWKIRRVGSLSGSFSGCHWIPITWEPGSSIPSIMPSGARAVTLFVPFPGL